MPLTGEPPIYTRGYSFTQHSIDQPNVPQPGDKLDAEFDDIATAVNDGNATLQGLTNPDGTLKDGIVGEDQLVPGLFDSILNDAAVQIQPMVDAAAQSADDAQYWATQAQASAVAADQSAQDAAAAVTTANDVFLQARAFAGQTSFDSQAAADSATAADNSRSTAENAMVNSLMYSELSFKWAEYLAGPVEPAPPGWPEAVDDGLWSSKWWALRARDYVGAWGTLYLGAFPVAPTHDPNTPPWVPGTIYYDTTNGVMMVWDGLHWKPITEPGPSVQGTFIYIATAGQQDFSGPDVSGKTPIFDQTYPEPCDLHINGVRVVTDAAMGGAGLGDYTVDTVNSALHVNLPLDAGAVVQWDLYVPPGRLAPGSVVAFKLTDIGRDTTTGEQTVFDGVETTFPLSYLDSTSGTTLPCTPGDGVQLQISLDGVMQEYGVDFTVNVSDIVFSEAPMPQARFWGVWYQPGLPA